MTGGTGALGGGVVEWLRERGATVHVPAAPPAGPMLDQEAAAVAYFASLPPLWASIHLVGGFAMGAITDTSFATFEQQWRMNTATCFLSCREAVRSIRRRGGGGRIVNVAARPVLAPVAQMVAYTAAKAGVAAITQTLAAELLAEGILVNAVVPSIIDSPVNRAAMPDADHAAWPTPAQLAEAVGYLVAPENSLTSGALVPVYGRA